MSGGWIVKIQFSSHHSMNTREVLILVNSMTQSYQSTVLQVSLIQKSRIDEQKYGWCSSVQSSEKFTKNDDSKSEVCKNIHCNLELLPVRVAESKLNLSCTSMALIARCTYYTCVKV